MSIAVVITTIQPPSPGVQAIAQRADSSFCEVIVIGDLKSPTDFDCTGTRFLSIDEQQTLDFTLAGLVPANSYTRKMLGYLIAVQGGAKWIRETDDDNTPYDSFFEAPSNSVVARVPESDSRWVNIYTYFTDRFIWPRGFPLNRVQASSAVAARGLEIREVTGPIVFQALADGDPDVDAVYRLTAPNSSDVRFADELPLVVSGGIWTPFNSQATTWPRELLPLMYLPSTCSFRMTDIWRSFVALRLLQGLGGSLVVTSPTVYQDRNEHDLMRDFRDEVEGYVGYERLVDTLIDTRTQGGVENILTDLRRLYEALIAGGFLRAEELAVLDAWIADVTTLGFGSVT